MVGGRQHLCCHTLHPLTVQLAAGTALQRLGNPGSCAERQQHQREQEQDGLRPPARPHAPLPQSLPASHCTTPQHWLPDVHQGVFTPGGFTHVAPGHCAPLQLSVILLPSGHSFLELPHSPVLAQQPVTPTQSVHPSGAPPSSHVCCTSPAAQPTPTRAVRWWLPHLMSARLRIRGM